MDLELEYYLGILERNEKEFLKDYNEFEKFKFMCNKFIELMDYLKATYDKQFVKNALLTLLAIFQQNESSLIYGRNLNQISELEREKCFDILKTEIF